MTDQTQSELIERAQKAQKYLAESAGLCEAFTQVEASDLQMGFRFSSSVVTDLIAEIQRLNNHMEQYRVALKDAAGVQR